MKLETSIAMRADGTVLVHGLNKKDYEFKLEADSGMVVCEVDHPETLAHLLRLGEFFPANESDHDKAASMIDLLQESADVDGDESGEDEDDDIDPNAQPLEAGTPPAPKKKKAKAE